MKKISEKINWFDIVNVQEDLHYHQELYGNENKHRYRTAHKIAILYGDGIALSDHYTISTILKWKKK